MEIKGNVEIPKIAFGLKFPRKKTTLDKLELDLYLNMLTTILFGSSSLFRERVRQEKLLSGLYTEWESLDDYRTFYFMASSLYPDRLIKEIKKEFKNIVIEEGDFNRIKKVWIANEVRIIDNMDATVSNLYDDILKYHEVIPDKIEKIRSMKLSTLENLIEEIDFQNISVVKMLPNKK